MPHGPQMLTVELFLRARLKFSFAAFCHEVATDVDERFSEAAASVVLAS